MASSELLAAIKAVDDQINAIHSAFGAPGDYGYATPRGEALYGLLKSQGLLRVAMVAERARYNAVVPCRRSDKCSWPACDADCDGRPGWG